MPRFRLGAVSYLNSKPLIHALFDQADWDLRLDLPSRLASGLLAHEFDAALVPLVVLFDHPQLVVVSDACIACRGPVWSVKLCSRVPMDRIRSLSLDEGSRTSAVLAKLLLRQRFGLNPDYRSLPINADWTATATDAVLVIGDRAIQNTRCFPHVWDLGEEWTCQFGLPFVFAVWAAWPDADLLGLSTGLALARDRGQSKIAEIACEQSAILELDAARCESYLRENLHYRLEAAERRGIERFYRLAVDAGFAQNGWELKHHDFQAVA